MLTFSFPVKSALTLLQERIPATAFSPLLHFQKNTSVTAHDKEQILNLLASLLVQGDSHVTLSIARIFRPILIDLVARVIKNGNDHLTQFASISSSFSLLLPMAPHLLGFVLEYLGKSPSIFDKLLSQNVDFSSYSDTDETWLNLAQTCYRLYRFSPKIFGKLWNWSPLFSMLRHDNPRMRWYVVGSLQLVMDLSDANIAPLRPLVETVHQQLSLYEAEFLALETAIMFTDSQPITQANIDPTIKHEIIVIDEEEDVRSDLCFTKDDLCDALVDVCGILLPKRVTEKTTIQSKLVYTTTSQQNMRALALAVCQGAPILLEGTTGSGKTSLIDELALITASNNIIKIHLGDQADAKVLLGTYVCTEIPGEFRWQQGALTQAVSEGRWIVIEDIDLAPMEVLSVLIPLLETRKLFIPGRGEVIDAAPGFQLFATQTLFGSTLSSRDQSGRIAHHLWTRVVVEPLTSAELTTVLSTHFPEVKNLVPKMIETFTLLTQAMSGSIDERSGMRQLVISGSRLFSTRDLVKWVQRIHLIDRSAVERETSAAREQIFMEAVDCFCCMIPKRDIREKFIRVIAGVWNVWETRTDYYLKYKPDINKVGNVFTAGRVDIKVDEKEGLYLHANTKFAHTGHTLRLLERIAASVRLNEPVLLVGDTGTGKTSTIQYIADMLQQKLIVLNLNQQSDSSDLLGGFKPMEMRLICTPLKDTFEKLFKKTFSEQKNTEFLTKVSSAYASKNWGQFLTLLRKAVQFFEKKVAETESKPNGKSMRPKLRETWKNFSANVSKFAVQYEQAKNNFSFSFVEGSLVKAVREGYWVLLDEINLASTETLESLSGLLEGGSLTLNERGDVEPIARHPGFRVFGCMNPPTDIGKKDLPPGIRNRFTEFFVDEMDNPEDLKVIVMAYLKDIAASPPVVDVVDFYLAARELATTKLTDGANQRPHYSLRTLSRALEYSRMIVAHYGLQRALFEGISMSFLTQLNRQSYPEMLELIKKHLAKKGYIK